MIYLDHNAPTPIAVEAADATRLCLEHAFGNPSSAHERGVVARAAPAARYPARRRPTA